MERRLSQARRTSDGHSSGRLLDRHGRIQEGGEKFRRQLRGFSPDDSPSYLVNYLVDTLQLYTNTHSYTGCITTLERRGRRVEVSQVESAPEDELLCPPASPDLQQISLF